MASKNNRWVLFDELRGLSVILLVFYHAFYDMGHIFGSALGYRLQSFFAPAVPFFAGLFIFICGVSCNFSHSNLKRGLLVALFALLLTLFTRFFMPAQIILFGILHMLSAGILLYIPMARGIKKFPTWLGVLLSVLLFILTYRLPDGYISFPGLFSAPLPTSLYSTNYLFFLGFTNSSFYSADYYPLFPWLFLFWTGAFFGVYAVKNKLPQFFKNPHIRPIAFVGRHTLWVYLLHQPVVYGLLWLYYHFINIRLG